MEIDISMFDAFRKERKEANHLLSRVGKAFSAGNVTLYPHNMAKEQWRNELAARAMGICPVNVYEHGEASSWCYARADAMIEEGKKEVEQ